MNVMLCLSIISKQLEATTGPLPKACIGSIGMSSSLRLLSIEVGELECDLVLRGLRMCARARSWRFFQAKFVALIILTVSSALLWQHIIFSSPSFIKQVNS